MKRPLNSVFTFAKQTSFAPSIPPIRMLHNATSHIQPRNIILDFDGTITTKDTISVLANFALDHQKARGNDLTKAWQEILARYGEDFSNHFENYWPNREERSSPEQEIAYHRSLEEVEMRSFARVSASGLFKGISPDLWRKAGRDMVCSGDVVVCKGFREFISDSLSQGNRCAIVSVNFSKDFISGVLEASASPNASSKIEVLANMADEEGVISGPSRSGNVMATSSAKLASMRRLLSSWQTHSSSNGKAIYIGDSGTDIECLLAEEVIGIVMSENGDGSLMEMLQRIEIKVEKLAEYQEGKNGTLYLASDYRDISNNFLSNVYRS
jgi:2-hydroxy-3-keto-5-methylthiopentenyl-1-phosphate phosphatase